MRDTAILNNLPAAQMTPQEYASHAIVVGVEVNPDPASPRRLMVPAEEVEQFDALRAEIARCAPHLRRGLSQVAQRELESRFVMSIMNLDLQSDALSARLPGGRPMVLARVETTSRFGRRAIAERAHREEVVQANTRGEAVHEECRSYYRVSAPHQQHAHAA